ncbi:hypothetical protein RRG08_007546 [Elysia crispata]|uniref:TNFR-Cys domain-containing protein n=1 Tax=Elysia crispata TaxID=231223 RepID=A0AAE1CXM2_9GAST|nr:hypothetical protein RRG08_007546 [Elysia crispata]
MPVLSQYHIVFYLSSFVIIGAYSECTGPAVTYKCVSFRSDFSCTGQEVAGGERACPQGQIERHLEWEYRCCKPVRCGRGYKVNICIANGTQDTCKQCGTFTNQSLRTSSYTMDECVHWPLNDKCLYHSRKELDLTSNRTKECLCDVEKGVFFSAPEVTKGAPSEAFCQLIRVPQCSPGFEPKVDGTCAKCKDNYFKSHTGFRLCEPKTNCSKLNLRYLHESRGPSEDNKCSKPLLVTTPKPKVTEPPDPGRAISSTRVTTPGTSTIAGGGEEGSVGSSLGTEKQDRREGDGDSSRVGPILGIVLFLVVLVVIIAVILFYRKRKGLSFCCGSTKSCSDLEKNNPALMAEPHQRNKIMLGNCSNSSNGLVTTANKVMNNNTSSNGRIPHYSMSTTTGEARHENVSMQRVNFQGEDMSWDQEDSSNHHRVRHTSFTTEDHSQLQPNELVPASDMFPPSPSRSQPLANVSPRPGILRNGGPAWKHGQAQAMDSIAREKLQVQMLGREANMEAGGESDPLLVSEGQAGARRAASPHGVLGNFQNVPGSNAMSASPPIVQGVMNQRQYLQHPLANSNSSAPEVTFVHHSPYGHPPKVVATFTRSSSVIATPEGEVDEDDMEARVPRFSQLLPDMDGGDTASNTENSPDCEEGQDPRRVEESSGTTQQLRSPNQRLLPRVTLGQGRTYQTSQPRTAPAPPASRRIDGSQPDHHIMNLKEQQLQESLISSQSSSLNSQLKFPSDVSETEALKTMTPEDVPHHQPCTQETTLKTQLSPIEDSDFSEAAVMNTGRKVGKALEPKTSEETEQKKMAGEVGGSEIVSSNNHNSLERKRVQAARDRRRIASGGSTNSNSSTSDCHRNQSSSDQPTKASAEKTVTNFSTAATKAVKVPLSSHTIPFEGEEENEETLNPDKTEDIEQTEQKQVSRESQMSSGSSTHNTEHSPNRANAYQRSQSENISSGSESPHRPPPRSNSEEKPQSSMRPVAKVRPMPATDSPVPGKSAEGARPTPGQGNILSYSSEEGSEDEETDASSRANSEDEEDMEAGLNNVTTPRREGQTEEDRD